MTVKLLNGERVYNDWYNFAATKYQGVETGCAVTEKGTPDMSVDVAAGTAIVAGLEVTVTGGNVPLDASDPTHDRFDLIVVNGSGTLSFIKGTPAADPKPDDAYDPTLYAILARVRVQDAVTQVFNADIKDMRFVPGGGGGGASFLPSAPQSGCANGDAVRFDGTDYVPAQADTINNSKAVGMIANIIGSVGDVYLFGEFDFLSGLTPGDTYYLSDSTAGGITNDRPGVAVKMGEASAADTLLVDIDRNLTPVGSKYVQTFTGQTTINVNHNLDDSDVLVQVYDSNGEQVTPDIIDILNANTVNVQFTVATSGKVVVYSMTGFITDTGTSSYYSMAFTSQTTVVVNHSLNQQYVAVQVYDATDNLIDPQGVFLNTADQCTVTFGTATTGRVVIVGGATFTSAGGAGSIIPDTDNAYDLGSASKKWRDGFFGNDVVIDGKLTVAGGIDPIYLQLDPQANDTPVLNNSIWIDSSDGYKLKLKNNGGTSIEVGLTPDGVTVEINTSTNLLQIASSYRGDIETRLLYLEGLAGIPYSDFDGAQVDTMQILAGYDGTVNLIDTTTEYWPIPGTGLYILGDSAITTSGPSETPPTGTAGPSTRQVTGTIINDGYFSSVTQGFGATSVPVFTIYRNGNIIAQKTGPSTTGYTMAFALSDYSETFKVGDTFLITVSGNNTHYHASAGYAGTDFSYGAQTAQSAGLLKYRAVSGVVGNNALVFAADLTLPPVTSIYFYLKEASVGTFTITATDGVSNLVIAPNTQTDIAFTPNEIKVQNTAAVNIAGYALYYW